MRQHGYSLLEVLAVLALVGLLLTYVIQRGASAEQSIAPATFAGELADWTLRVRSSGSSQDYRNFSVSPATAIAPDGWRNADGTVRHPYGGAVTVAVGAWRGVDNSALVWTASGIPGDVCGIVAERLATNAAALSVGTTTLKSAPATLVTLAQAQTACEGKTNTIQWTLL